MDTLFMTIGNTQKIPGKISHQIQYPLDTFSDLKFEAKLIYKEFHKHCHVIISD